MILKLGYTVKAIRNEIANRIDEIGDIKFINMYRNRNDYKNMLSI